MAYLKAPQSDQQVSLRFFSSNKDKLYISLAFVSLLPSSALVIGLAITLRALFSTIRERRWVNGVEFESWWLIKAPRPDMYCEGNSNATEKDFNDALAGFSSSYGDILPDNEVGQLALRSVGPSENLKRISLVATRKRVYK
jgi:hypothetical protein